MLTWFRLVAGTASPPDWSSLMVSGAAVQFDGPWAAPPVSLRL